MMKTLIACTFAAVAIAAPKAESNEAWNSMTIRDHVKANWGDQDWSWARDDNDEWNLVTPDTRKRFAT